MRPLRESEPPASAGGLSRTLHASQITHPLTQVVLTCRPPFAKEILHHFSALFLEHSGGNFNSMIQKIRITNSESRFHGSSPFIARAIYQPFYSRLYQGAGTHHAGFNC